MRFHFLFCVSVVMLLPTQGFADEDIELAETITDSYHASSGTYTVHSSGTTTITDGKTYGGQVLVGAAVSYGGGNPANLKIAKGDNLTINCRNLGSIAFEYYSIADPDHLQSRNPNFVIAGSGTLDVGTGGKIVLTNGQMIMAGARSNLKSISNVSGKIDVTGGLWSITGLNTTVNVNSSAEISLRGGYTEVANSAEFNLTRGTMKVVDGTLDIKNDNFIMSGSGILDLLDMTDFSKISGKINMNYDGEHNFGIYIRYLHPDDIERKTSATLSGTGFVHVYPNYSKTIDINKDTGIIKYFLGAVSKSLEELREYMVEDLGFTIEGDIQFKWHDTATGWLNYVLASATDDEGNPLNSSNYTIDLDSLFDKYNTKNIKLPASQYSDAERFEGINCKLKCSPEYSVILPTVSVTFNNDLSEFEGTLMGRNGYGNVLTFNAEPPSGDIISMSHPVIYNKKGAVAICGYNELSTFSIPEGTEVHLLEEGAIAAIMDEPHAGGN